MYTFSNILTRIWAIHFVYAWDRSGQRDITELSAMNPENSKNLFDWLPRDFPFDAFLGLFDAWKGAQDPERRTHLFALMRDMHQSVGINKKSIAFWADAEMQVFWEYVSKIFYNRRVSKKEIRAIAMTDIERDLSPWEPRFDTSFRIEVTPVAWTEKEKPLKYEGPVWWPSWIKLPEHISKGASGRQRATTPKIVPPWQWDGIPPSNAPSQAEIIPPNFSKEQAEVNTILRTNWDEEENNLKGFGWAWAIPSGDTWTKDRYYARISDGFITKALLNPRDSKNMILYWPHDTSEARNRKVYLLSPEKKVIGCISIDKDGRIHSPVWEEMKEFPYTVPSPIRTNTQAVKWRIN